ncbi:hypothetical protein B9Z55_008898 [Caenorhabditis nigoni]|uniref:Uncharacterized protein n=1 Tax=Caenorhabditis nigoni TaxID=1611254 RepID=A0A2G5UPM0_9PELO|nr:hypothetical protein B9Z55_008898 [Caenorhabditis nigoni]
MSQPVEQLQYIHPNAMGIAQEHQRLRNSDQGSDAKRIVSPKFVGKTGLVRDWDPDVYYDALETLVNQLRIHNPHLDVLLNDLKLGKLCQNEAKAFYEFAGFFYHRIGTEKLHEILNIIKFKKSICYKFKKKSYRLCSSKNKIEDELT